jgi:hypothetical protein
MKPYIKIACPVYKYDTWEGSIAKSCVANLKSELFDFKLGVEIGNNIELSRNAILNENREEYCIRQDLSHLPYTHYLLLDHDVGFTGDHVETLIKRDLPIVSGVYRDKETGDHYVAGYCDELGKLLSYVPTTQQGLISVGWCGGGFILVKKNVLEKMQFPWFWLGLEYYSNRALMIGGDFYFCRNARRNGFDIMLDTSVILNHEYNRLEVKNDIV